MKDHNKIKRQLAQRRRARVKAAISGNSLVPRLRVTRSLNYVYLQLIDDQLGRTVASCHSKKVDIKGKKTEVAFAAGEELARKALAAGFKQCVFDRGGHIYHGIVKAVAEGARQGGLKF